MPHPLTFLVPEETLKLDSVAFTDKEIYVISDRSNLREEFPVAKISLITTEKYGPQIRVAIHGDQHVEKLSKYKRDPKAWNSWGWIIIPIKELDKLTKLITKMNAFVHFKEEK